MLEERRLFNRQNKTFFSGYQLSAHIFCDDFAGLNHQNELTISIKLRSLSFFFDSENLALFPPLKS